MTKLTYVEGIGVAHAQKLKETCIKSVEDLLKKAGSAQGRKELAIQSGIQVDALLRWVNHADLLRIKGIGAEYAELLEAAGVDSSIELARRSSEKLYQRLLEVNQAKKLVRKLPTEFQLDQWISQAKRLSKIVFH
jgi:predicted flap endonuclease-1-like 5' DNA nuclease